MTGEYDELREDAKKDPQGRITRAAIHWDRVGHKQNASLPNTLLGTLRIQDRRMTVEALLLDMERDRGSDPLTAEANHKGAKRVRELLGLRSRGRP